MLYNIGIFLRFMVTDQNSSISSPKLPQTGMLLKMTIVIVVLFAIFFVLLGLLWVRLPVEGVKLHGTVDIGVDLLGTRNDLFWFVWFGLVVFVFNMSLAFVMIKREILASVYLVSATGIVCSLLIVTMLFLFRLNKII